MTRIENWLREKTSPKELESWVGMLKERFPDIEANRRITHLRVFLEELAATLEFELAAGMREFPKNVIKSYEILSRDLQELENRGHQNPHLKVILKFIDRIEIDWNGVARIADEALRNLESEPAAESTNPQVSPISEQLRKEAVAPERSDGGEGNLNKPPKDSERSERSSTLFHERPMYNYLQDLEEIAQELKDYGITLNYQLNKIKKI